MKFFYTVILLFLFTSIKLFGQTYSFDVEVKNFTQVDETTFEWEIWLKKADGSSDFALWQMQTRMDFNENILNTGAFVNAYFTIAEVGPSMNQNLLFFIDDDCTMVGTSPNIQFNWAVSNPPNTGQSMTIISDTWLKVAKFRAQLRKDGNPHHFADADPEFAFQASGTQILVTRANTTAATYDGEGITPVPKNSTTPPLGVKVNTRQLAGYCFTGTGNWSETARWNNVTTTNNHTLPGSSNNVMIVGQATVAAAYIVDQLSVNEGAHLALDPAAKLSTANLYNDNSLGGGGGTLTIAGWDFQNLSKTTLPYTSDIGVATNINIALANTDGSFVALTDAVSGGTRVVMGNNFYASSGFPPVKTFYSWKIQFNTSGYQSLTLSSKQWSDNNSFGTFGPISFKIQYSLDGSNWTDVNGGIITVAENWTTGVISNLALPEAINNLTSVYLRWLNNASENSGYTAIDDIIITGEPLPSGILIESTAAGTGSLLHNTDGIEATIERYLPAAGYHLVSIPFTQASNPVSGWFIWSYLYNFDVSTQAWVAMGSPTVTPLNIDQGYMVYKYPGPAKWSADTTYAMTGFMNSGSFMCAVSGDAKDHNLVPNPYPSAIDWDAAAGWTKSDIYNAIWIWNNGNYAAYVNGTPANGGSKHIPVGQAFFIQASGASAGLTMNNDVRVHNDQPFFKDAEEQLNVLRIKAKSNNYQDEIVVYFNGEASTAFDGQFDASKMFGLPEAPQIYSVSTDNRNLTINGMPFSSEVISIPVGFSLETAGEVTFEASSIESFDPEVTIFLWDMLTNTMINLRENQQYSFVHNPDNDPVRFALLFNSAVGIAESATNPVRLYATDNKLYLHIPEEIDEDFLVQLYDTGGRMIFSTTASTGSTIINVPSLGAGIYIVQLVSDQHSVVKKVFMK